jgi:hypothetical protein
MKTFVALYMGSPQRMQDSPPDEATMARGMAAWGKWMSDHAADLVDNGGPLGKTKRIDAGGVSDVRNEVGGYVVVRAADHQAAAKMFKNHPHFAIFPGERVEVMEVLPIPGM